MAARKLTKSPEGEVVTFSTKRGKPDTPLEELSKDEASDIIDELKGELGYD